MSLALKRYKDGSYIPLFKPWMRKIESGTKPKKSTFTSRYKEATKQVKDGTYKKTWFDRNIVDNIIPK